MWKNKMMHTLLFWCVRMAAKIYKKHGILTLEQAIICEGEMSSLLTLMKRMVMFLLVMPLKLQFLVKDTSSFK